MILAVLLTVGACKAHLLSTPEAKQLALAAPNIQAAVQMNHAIPRFEFIEARQGGWYFSINSANPCPTPRPCSKLLGHYTVDKVAGEVVDLDAGEDGKRVTSPEMVRLRRTFFARDCRY